MRASTDAVSSTILMFQGLQDGGHPWHGDRIQVQRQYTLHFFQIGDQTMHDQYDQAGFEDSILYSDDDYEPYGYDARQLMPIGAAIGVGKSPVVRDRVIEAELLNQSTMVGC